jgi:NAD(P)-dependent dehydrogenase (short-subunit alcohol dehydrogenase family)
MNKVAVITGASQGIGAATVSAYRKLGWSVVANSRSITPSDIPVSSPYRGTSPTRRSAPG